MSIKQQIEQDIKTAMLAGDKTRVMTLRGLKSAILYAEVAKGSRDVGLSDAEQVEVLGKEAKKRQESAELYIQGGDSVRANAELEERQIIEKYLPTQLTDEVLENLVDQAIAKFGADKSQMGALITEVKNQSVGQADGGRIAQIVKRKLT